MIVTAIIRVLNEATALDILLGQLKEQKFNGDLELIVVDNESDDESASVARQHGAKVLSMPRSEFSYPKASNLGIKTASGKFIAMISAHAELIDDNWISNGLLQFEDPTVVGVYGPQTAMNDSPRAEKLYYGFSSRFLGLGRTASRQKRAGMGVMGAGNCMIRGSYLRDNSYDESFGAGGEDEAWGRRALSQGHGIIRDPAFIVRHSHRLGFFNLMRQHLYWFSLKKPGSFSRTRLSGYGRPYKDDKG